MSDNPPAPKPSRSRRRPASRLQAARLERGWSQRQVAERIRQVCRGHGPQPCRMNVSKLSEYERGHARPALVHLEALCQVYQQPPEALGLITWHNGQPTDPPLPPAPNAAAPPAADPSPPPATDPPPAPAAADTAPAPGASSQPPAALPVWLTLIIWPPGSTPPDGHPLVISNGDGNPPRTRHRRLR